MSFSMLISRPFENGDLLVRLYQRSDDGRSRFLCRTLRPARRRKDVVLPLVSLTVSRSGPFLKFEDIIDGYPELWACLKFPSFEREASILLNLMERMANQSTKSWCCSSAHFLL